MMLEMTAVVFVSFCVPKKTPQKQQTTPGLEYDVFAALNA